MKKIIGHMSAATVICISINSAIAAGSSLNLKVKGEITAPSCIINLNDNGVVDLGKIATNSIQANTPTKLNDPRPITIQATCDADTALTFSIVDNRVATASTPSTKHFGLGSVNGTGKLGYYGIKMKMGYVDSKEVNLFAVAKSSASFGTSKEVDVDTSKIMGWSESDNKLAIGKNFISVLQVMPYLASAKDMGGSVPEDTKLDGSATLSFAFGI